MASFESDNNLSIEIPLKLYFSTEEPIAIRDIANSLIGLDKMLKNFPAMIGEMSKVYVRESEIHVTELVSGSLLEDLMLKLYFDSPEDLEGFRKFLEDAPMGKLIRAGGAALIVLLLAGQLFSMYQSFKGNNESVSNTYNNTNIIVGAESYGIDPDNIRRIIEAGIVKKNPRAQLKAATEMMLPLKDKKNGSLQAGDGSSELKMEIPNEVVQEIPFNEDIASIGDEIEYKNQKLIIRALDRDKTTSGWSGSLPDVLGEKRLKLMFSDAEDSEKIGFRSSVNVDATVIYQRNLNQGTLIPKQIVIDKVYSEQSH